MYILGVNAYHGDSSACIYKDGTLIAATEEERIRRFKHWAGLPTEAIQFCLNEAGITLKDVDYITVSRNPLAKIDEKICYITGNTASMPEVASDAACLVNPFSVDDIRNGIQKIINDDTYRNKLIQNGRVNRERFNPEVIANAYFEIYKEVLEKN